MIFLKEKIGLVLLLALLPIGALAQTPMLVPASKPDTSSSGQQISNIKQMQADIQADIKAKKIKELHKETDPEATWSVEESFFLDEDGKARAYHFSEGNGDFARECDYFYDEDGHLRMVVSHMGSESGSDDKRVFLNQKGEMLGVEMKNKKGNWASVTLTGSELSIEWVWKPKEEFNKPLQKPGGNS